MGKPYGVCYWGEVWCLVICYGGSYFREIYYTGVYMQMGNVHVHKGNACTLSVRTMFTSIL